MRLTTPFHHALPVDDRLFHEGVYLTHVGWELIAPGGAYPNRDHPSLYYFKWEDGRILPSFCLAMVVEGRGEFQTKKHRRTIGPGECFLILPGEWHRHRPDPATGWRMAWVEFSGTLAFDWWREGAFGTPANFPVVADPALLLAQFTRLLGDVHKTPSRNTTDFSRQTIGIISHIAREPERETAPGVTGDAPVDRAVACIWNYSHGVLNVSAVAEHVGLGRRTLERRFGAALGRGVLDEIQRCRFTRAARLLSETSLPVKLVVDRAGFGSQDRMRLLFLKRCGLTPEAYRKSRTGAAES